MGQTTTAVSKRTSRKAPRSVALAKRGVKTSQDFAGLMSGLMSDVIEGRIAPGVVTAACSAGGKLLKVVEMEYKYGSKGTKAEEKSLLLSAQ